jgi:4-amino-4-deoxy-L-arabinose transferase-like glycosyltransferase
MTSGLRKILFIALILNLALAAWAAAGIVPFPYGMDYGEAPLIDQARRIAAGQTIYKPDLQTPPYVIANYPPLYPLLIAGAGRLTGLPLFPVGRAISVAGALLAGLSIGLLAARLFGSRLAGLLAATLLLGNPLVILWGSVARVDLLALGLSLAALWLLYSRGRSWPWLAVAMLCLAAAIFTRQTSALAAPAAGAVWLWRCDRRRGLAFVAGLALAVALVFGALNYATGGGFYLHTVVANVNAFDPGRLPPMAGRLASVWPFVILIVGVMVVTVLSRPGKPATPRRMKAAEAAPMPPERRAWEPAPLFSGQPFLWYGLAIYTLGALGPAVAVGKVGANVNYFLELMAATAIWAAGAVVWPAGRPALRRAAGYLALGQVAWAIVGAFLLYREVVAVHWRDLPTYDALYREVAAAARQGPVLADEYLDMVVLAGQGIYFQPFEYQQLYQTGRWDPAALVGELASRRFSLIAIHPPGDVYNVERWPPAVTAAITAYYQLAGQQREIMLYK